MAARSISVSATAKLAYSWNREGRHMNALQSHRDRADALGHYIHVDRRCRADELATIKREREA